MITNVDDTVDVIFSPLASLACEATVVAIGGGGQGGSYGGGGSGYVKSDVIGVSSTEYQASVGQYGQDSVLRIKNGQNVMTAQAGGNCAGNNGGDGYSGGGGYGYGANGYGGNGGSDGSNGCCNSDNGGSDGGSGSGLDISTISLKYFMLSPGNGGEHNGHIGGGGGGVLVDNVGPYSDNNQGEGYGGGGGYYNGNGLQGMILIETKSKT